MDGVGRTERPCLRRAVMQRIGQHEQTRQRLIGLAGEFLADALYRFARAVNENAKALGSATRSLARGAPRVALVHRISTT